MPTVTVAAFVEGLIWGNVAVYSPRSTDKLNAYSMKTYAYRIVNVFAETTLGGNPLCVFEDGRDLEPATMQALALQFNLSETTFILPATTPDATARVRIFTPSFEMPFAGHPTLGSAHVVRALLKAGDAVKLEMPAGIIPVTAETDRWTLLAGRPGTVPPSRSAAIRADLAKMLSLNEGDIAGDALWVDTGSEQLIIPLASVDAVARAQANIEQLIAHGTNEKRQGLAYVWAHDRTDGLDKVRARFFFNKQGAVAEDPGTGSATANLGGYFLTTGAQLPINLAITQGIQTGRPCAIGLRVTAAKEIFVSGRVIELGRGVVTL